MIIQSNALKFYFLYLLYKDQSPHVVLECKCRSAHTEESEILLFYFSVLLLGELLPQLIHYVMELIHLGAFH